MSGPPPLARPLSRARLPLFGWLVVIGTGQAIGTVGTALLVEVAFDALFAGDQPARAGQVALLSSGLVAAVGLAAGMRAAERVGAERLGQHYVTQVRAQLFDHLTRVPARELGQRNRGSMLLRFVGDLSALRSWVSLGLARLLVAGIAIVLAITALAVINAGIGLVVAGVLLCGAVATWRINPRLLDSAKVARNRRAKLTGEVAERLSHVGVLQAAGQEHRERRRVGKYSRRVSVAMVDRARAAGAARGIAEGTAGLAAVAVLLLGSMEVRAGRATVGTVVGAMAVAGLIAGHLRDLGRVTEYAAGAKVAREAARRFLTLPTLSDPPGLPDLVPGPGRIDLEALGLGDALLGVTLRSQAGQTVAIVGRNGAGKSSLVSLVARLVDPDHGRVLLDGQDVRTCNLASVRAAVGVAGPDLPLLRGTVERNVRYRQPAASRDELDRVARLCGLDDLVGELPRGWQAEVGDGGSRLSAGQRARVAVARAALGRPSVLVLDEAEAHLDRKAADVVDQVLADHTGTALVVTHRRELVERADVVWCLDNGRVAEVGPPGVLLAADTRTARLFRSDAREHPGDSLVGGNTEEDSVGRAAERQDVAVPAQDAGLAAGGPAGDGPPPRGDAVADLGGLGRVVAGHHQADSGVRATLVLDDPATRPAVRGA